MLTSLLFSTVLFACKSEIDNKPTAEVKAVTEQPQKAPQQEVVDGTTLKMKDGSTLGFVGAKVTADHAGGFKNMTGTATVDKAGKLVGINAAIDIASTFSDSERLTKHLLSPDFFDVQKYPTATFTSTQIADGKVTGTLDMHGKKNEISFPAEIAASSQSVAVKGEFTINRKNWDINYPGKPDNLIKNDVLIKLAVEYGVQ